jgi:hypothetical protein
MLVTYVFIPHTTLPLHSVFCILHTVFWILRPVLCTRHAVFCMLYAVCWDLIYLDVTICFLFPASLLFLTFNTCLMIYVSHVYLCVVCLRSCLRYHALDCSWFSCESKTFLLISLSPLFSCLALYFLLSILILRKLTPCKVQLYSFPSSLCLSWSYDVMVISNAIWLTSFHSCLSFIPHSYLLLHRHQLTTHPCSFDHTRDVLWCDPR